MLSTSSMRYRASMLSALVLCAGVAASLPDMSPAERDAAETGPVGYGLMMDAGSTGSRVHVYRWVWHGDDKLPTITDDFFKQVKPGLSAQAADPAAAAASLQPLLDYAVTVMPADAVKDAWVRLYATAGLRLLPPAAQDGLLSAVRGTLAASPFVFDPTWVAIADGVTEAVDAWVSANYILGVATAPDAEATVGTIDLGGGSIQVCTRATAGDFDVGPADIRFDLDLGGTASTLYAKSHLAYGLMETRKRIDRMVETQLQALSLTGTPAVGWSGLEVPHSCLLAGDSLSFDGPGLKVKRVKGNATLDTCLDMMRTLGKDCQDLPAADCMPMVSVPAPKFTGKFLAFSYLYDILPEFVAGDEPSVAEIRAAAATVCSTSLTDLEAKHPTYEAHNREFIRRACQDMSYLVFLLSDYLGFAESERRIQLVKQINGKEMSWTLGATLRMLKKPAPKAEL